MRYAETEEAEILRRCSTVRIDRSSIFVLFSDALFFFGVSEKGFKLLGLYLFNRIRLADSYRPV